MDGRVGQSDGRGDAHADHEAEPDGEDAEEGDHAAVLDEVGAELPVNLVYADREFIDPKVRKFVDRAVEAIAREMPKPLDMTR